MATKNKRKPSGTNRPVGANKPARTGGRNASRSQAQASGKMPNKASPPGTKPASQRRSRQATVASTKSGPSGHEDTGSITATNVQIGATDRRLLALLQADGRRSNLALAAAVGLSPAACHERVRKLLANGLISHFSAHLNAQALDAGLIVFATLQLDRTESKVVDNLRAMVTHHDEFMECHLLAGGADALLKLRTRDLSSYQVLLDSLVYPIPGVRGVSTLACTQTIKETCAVSL